MNKTPHQCHCGFREHRFIKGAGLAGAIFFVAHLLFHVVECVLLPALLVAFGYSTKITPNVPNRTPATSCFAPALIEPRVVSYFNDSFALPAIVSNPDTPVLRL